MRTLIINTYAGSLLLGADAIKGAQIIGSYEDAGFGATVTKANRHRFAELAPGFHFVDSLKHWPDQDLTDTVILAHPPCAAFSQQNTSKTKRGVNTDAFECTRKVLKYGMSSNAAAIAIESVPGALTGAWDVYEEMSQAGGYHVYRILKNSILFGVPQFRERFWAVLVRRGLAADEMVWRLTPRWVTVGSTIGHLQSRTEIEGLDRTITKFVQKLVTEHGLDDAEIRAAALSPIEGIRRIGFAKRVQERFFPGLDPKYVLRHYVSPFTSAQPSVLAPFGFAPVLLGSSLWVYEGRPVSKEGYCAIMGFPPDYVFPPDSHYGIRTYLSKGVCPPVATWILDNIRIHLGEPSGSSFTKPGGYVKECAPGRIVSFKPGKQDILDQLTMMRELGSPESDELVPLRDEEQDIIDKVNARSIPAMPGERRGHHEEEAARTEQHGQEVQLPVPGGPALGPSEKQRWG